MADIALQAGSCILEIAGAGNLRKRTKSSALDLVTRADDEAEALIRAELKRCFPGEPVTGEEGGRDGDPSHGFCWAIDPLDGTANFVLGIPHWCVSIGGLENDRSVVGVIYDPVRKELFAASRGGGAFLNGQALSPGRSELELSTWAVGLAEVLPSSRRPAWTQNLRPRLGRERAMGSLALDLAWTAAGRFDAFFYECGLCPWDYAGGEVICAEAGLEIVRVQPDAGFSAALLAVPPAWRDMALMALGITEAITAGPQRETTTGS